MHLSPRNLRMMRNASPPFFLHKALGIWPVARLVNALLQGCKPPGIPDP